MERYCLYLRKSRADMEAEARGEGETLARHKKHLFTVAKRLNINITKIYQEIVSGDRILDRPEMQSLLRDVEAGEWDGVLVMEVERLARGDTMDQGLVAQTFKEAGTKIITPMKIYDPNNEMDEEYFEFGLFMSRREYKTINRRLQRGRVDSAREGNYIGTRPPYGYNLFREGKDRYLVPHPEQSKAVKMIFEWYANGDMGANKIAAELNSLGFRTYTGKKWTSSSVLFILKNEVYIGRIQWKKKEHKKSRVPGKRETKTRPRDEWIDVQGKHQPLVDVNLFNKAQENLKRKYHVPYQLENGITNPLAGLIKCDICGYSMVLRPYTTQQPHLMCYNRFCANKSSRFSYVEESLLKALEELLVTIKADFGKRKRKKETNTGIELKEQAVKNIERELRDLSVQKEKLHDLLERGIYDEETYLNRSQSLSQRIEEKNEELKHAKSELENERSKVKVQKDIIPTVENVVKLYWRTNDPAKRNALLKSVISHATYRKEKYQRNDQFTLNIFPLFP